MKSLSYSDAVAILSKEDNATVQAFDRLLSGAIFTVSVCGAPQALALLGAKNEAAKLAGRLVAGALRSRKGATRRTRTEQIEAAHAVIVAGAYFDALGEVDSAQFNLSLGHKLELASATSGEASAVDNQSTFDVDFVSRLLRLPVPVLAPHKGYDTFLLELGRFYAALNKSLVSFIAGLENHQASSETVDRLSEELSDLRSKALVNYEDGLLRLAGSFPEVKFWIDRGTGQTIENRLESLAVSLSDLEIQLAQLSSGATVQAWRAGLAKSYKSVLKRQIIESGDVPDGLAIPHLELAYINPNFRVTEARKGSTPARESWWQAVPLRRDVEGFLLGLLTSSYALRHPLVVLGQPGSGKSVLTKVVAARLPAPDYLVVRVPLREVSAEAEIQDQIESAIRLETGDDVSWTDLARGSQGATSVVLLDGFDELLQATQVSQSDYLERVQKFQRREADQGRPLIVIVTSRTSVADRAPAALGTVFLRLEPFSVNQVRKWVRTWNSINEDYFERRQIQRLSEDKIVARDDLSTQPLLLLMLALYDAESNGLQDDGLHLRDGDLYEALLRRFAFRETQRDGTVRTEDASNQQVEDELDRLAIVAFAMFNRGRQWVSEADLQTDLSILYNSRMARGRREGSRHRPALGEAESALGRFFFIQESKALQAGQQLATYEFLHATFSEYLVARYTWKLYIETVSQPHGLRGGIGLTSVSDTNLRALLSFSVLSSRTQILGFLIEIAERDPIDRASAESVIRILLEQLLFGRDSLMSIEYEPSLHTVIHRYAAYSANLMLLLLTSGSGLVLHEFLEQRPSEALSWWQSQTGSWQANLSSEEVINLADYLNVKRLKDAAGEPVVVLHGRYEGDAPDFSDADWTSRLMVPEPGGKTLMNRSGESDKARTLGALLCNPMTDQREHALEPLNRHVPEFLDVYLTTDGLTCKSLGNALLGALACLAAEEPLDDRLTAYSNFVEFATWNLNQGELRQPGPILARLMMSDEELSPKQALQLFQKMETAEVGGTAIIRSILNFIRADDSAEGKLVDLLVRFLRFDDNLPSWVGLEAWVTLAEKGVLEKAGESWEMGPTAVLVNIDVESVQSERPHIYERWLAIRHVISDSASSSE